MHRLIFTEQLRFHAALIAFSLLTPAVARPQATGSIAGIVTATPMSLPLSDVRITLVGSERAAATDASGRYRLDGLAPGDYSLVRRIVDPEERAVAWRFVPSLSRFEALR